MRQRWLPVGVLALVLFAINAVTRLIVRFGFSGDEQAQSRASFVMFGLIGVLLGALAFVRAGREPVGRWLADLGTAAAVALLLTLFVGPFISGSTPLAGGAGDFFAQVWLYIGCAGGGMLLGYLLVTALGWDHRSQSLKRFAEARLARPRRVVRR
jgi:hypothetical protein